MAANLGFLEQYLDSLEILPSELQRNFSLMMDLDTRAHDEIKNIDTLSKEYLTNINNLSSDNKAESMRTINKLYKKAMDYADDKVQLAMQTYEMVDKHIRRLDADLKQVEADLRLKALNAHSSDSEASSKKKGRKSAEKFEKKRGKKIQSSDDEVAKSNKKKQKTVLPPPPTVAAAAAGTATPTTSSIVAFTAHPSDGLDMPVDPNEPTYCFCHQVSYGEMIGCDNPDCPIEWFHFACVDLTMKPKGKWYCSECTSDKKKKV